MLSRWYLLFVGMVLVIMGIAAFVAPRFLYVEALPSWVAWIWLLTGLVGLIVAFAVPSVTTLRWVAGIIGTVYVLWGIIALFTEPSGVTSNPVSLITFVLGALGLSAALAPAFWLRERETYATGNA